MKIRVDRPVGGLFPECQPEIGKVYDARPGAPLGGATRKGFVVIDLKQKKNIILREGEFEIVEEDTEKKVRGQWDKDRAFALLDRGMTVKEVAAELGVTVKQIEGAKYWRKRREKEVKMKKLYEEMETEREAETVGPEGQQNEDAGTEECAVRPEQAEGEKQISYSELTVMLCEAKAELENVKECADIRREQIDHLAGQLKEAQNEIWSLKKAIIALVLEKFA